MCLICWDHSCYTGDGRITVISVNYNLKVAASMSCACALGPAYNEHPAITSRFLCIKITACNVKKFGYYEQPLITSSSFASFTRCKPDPSCNVLLLILLLAFATYGEHFQRQILFVSSVIYCKCNEMKMKEKLCAHVIVLSSHYETQL